MKKIIIVLSLILTISMQSQEIVSKSNLVDELFKVTEVTKMIPNMVNTVIGSFKKKVTHIPESYWQEIVSSIDYSSFIDSSKQVYLDNFNVKELQELIILYKPETVDTYMEKVKKVEPQLYELGNGFGREIIQQITSKVKVYKG